MDEEDTKETVVAVSGAKIIEVLSNPEKAFNILRDFCDNISTLTTSMHNLYEQHPIELGLLGVRVEVIVRSEGISEGIGKELLHTEFGSKGTARDILTHPISKEEANEHYKDRP